MIAARTVSELYVHFRPNALEETVRRRKFLALTGAAAAAAAMHEMRIPGSPLGLPFGYQAWELAPDMKQDWDGTLKAMKACLSYTSAARNS